MTFSPSSRSTHGAITSGPLPAYLTPFVGRVGLLAEIQRQVLHPDIRMLTLVGPGGVGKTRLAIQAAAGLDAHFEDIVFVDFTPLADASLGMPLLGTTLGVVEDGASPLTSRLAAVLGKRELLLVLDNLERILEIGPDLTALLRACPGVTMLATSRAPLHVSGEQEFPVPPLDLSDAIALFVARAQAVRPSLSATPESEPMLAAVCDELDRLPLAIELAAARVKVLSIEAMLSRLEYRLALFTGGPLDSPRRQRTMRDAIAWSYDLLDEGDQRRFRRLAVFCWGIHARGIRACCRHRWQRDGRWVGQHCIAGRQESRPCFRSTGRRSRNRAIRFAGNDPRVCARMSRRQP